MSNPLMTWPNTAHLGTDALQAMKTGINLVRDVIQHLIDDTEDGGPIETVALSYRGIDYEIDLSRTSIADLDLALAPYLSSARRIDTPRPARAAANKVRSKTVSPREIRTWARSQGIEVADRGRLPVDVTHQYRQTHSG